MNTGTLPATGLFLALRERDRAERVKRIEQRISVAMLDLAIFRTVTVNSNIKPQETYDDTTRN